jgi:hypothetical protein
LSKLQPLSLMSPTIDGRFSTVPTATHVIALGHETSFKRVVSDGGVCELQVDPSEVATIPSPPTAVHSSIVKQEIDKGGNAESWIVQVAPPSLDFMIPASPPA